MDDLSEVAQEREKVTYGFLFTLFLWKCWCPSVSILAGTGRTKQDIPRTEAVSLKWWASCHKK